MGHQSKIVSNLATKVLGRTTDLPLMRIKPPSFIRAAFRLSAITPLLAALVSAQTDTAGLFGLVRDSSGGSIASSKVKLQNRATGAIREQATDAKGLYQFEVLSPGE